MKRGVQDAGNQDFASEYAKVRADRGQKITIAAEQFVTHAKMMRIERW